MARRDFDISWVKPPPGRGTEQAEDFDQGRGIPSDTASLRRVPDRLLLQVFRGRMDEPLRVTDIARISDLGFEEARSAVLELVSRNLLEITERDAAGDYLVTLTDGGRQALTAA